MVKCGRVQRWASAKNNIDLKIVSSYDIQLAIILSGYLRVEIKQLADLTAPTLTRNEINQTLDILQNFD